MLILSSSGLSNPQMESQSKAMLVFTPTEQPDNTSSNKTVEQYIHTNWLKDDAISKVVLNTPFDNSDSDPEIPLLIEVYGQAEQLLPAINNMASELKGIFDIEAYRVEENLPARYHISWNIGTASPGMRLISMIYKKDSLSKKEFSDYWHNQHAKVATSYTIPVWNYSQNTVTEILTANSPAFDGIAALHFKHKDDLKNRWLKTPLEAVRGPRDALNFMNMTNTRSQEMTETILKDSLR